MSGRVRERREREGKTIKSFGTELSIETWNGCMEHGWHSNYSERENEATMKTSKGCPRGQFSANTTLFKELHLGGGEDKPLTSHP